MYLSNKAKAIIGMVVGVLVLAGVIGGSIAIANAVKKNKQAKCEHVYGAGKITVESTCETAGVIVYTCSNCEYELTEEMPANGHVEATIEAIPATCSEKGLTDGVRCTTCEKVLVQPAAIPALGHKVEALKAVAPMCTAAGKTEGSMCSRCGAVLKVQALIPAKGHTVVEQKGFEPTCTEIGKTNGSYCSTCGRVYSLQEVIPALGHTDGNADGECDVCAQDGIMTNRVWELCTDVSDLHVGDQIILVATTYDIALGSTQNSNNRSGESVSKDGSQATISENVQVIIIEEGVQPGTFAFNVGSGYLYASSSSSNQLKTRAGIDANASWEITIDEEGVASIVAQGDNTKNMLLYNSANQLFSCYATSQVSVSIYKLVAVED